MTEDLDIRAAVLARIVCKATATGRKLGRTQVMKLVYFLQEWKDVQLGYDFRLFTYGPYDSEVLNDLSFARSRKQVAEEVVTYSHGYGYAITPEPVGENLSRELEQTDPDIARQVDEVVREFGRYGAGEMELRSTIFYADREKYQEGTTVTDNDLATIVKKIKPYFDHDMILGRVREMNNQGLLKALVAMG